MKKINIQATMTFAKDETTQDAAPRFRMIANAGSVMEFGLESIALDVDGIAARGESIPILYDHDFANGVGHSTSIFAEDGKLIVEGVVSRQTKYADDFVHSSKLGFPWQASVGGYVLDSITLKKGESLDLHGNEIVGPCTVATKFELYEVSVVEYGADANTESKVIAKKETQMDEQKEINAGAAFDVDAYREQMAAETQRVADIRARSLGNDEELQATAIREGWSADRFELETLRASRPAAPSVHTPVADVDSKALEAAVVRAAGFTPNEKRYSDQTLTAADRIGQIDFLEFCELATHAPQYSFRKDTMHKINAAFSTSNLGSVITNAANAILLQSFESTDTSWRRALKVSSVNNYKTNERWRLDPGFKFKELAPGGEMEHAEVSDDKFEIQAKLYARQFRLDERDIVNGDALGVLADLLNQIVFGANDAINEAVWSLFLNPATCADSKAFYHADHGSLLTSKPLNLDNLSAARAAFITRKKSKDDSPLGIAPALLVVPTSLEDKALMLTKATTINNGSTTDTPADYNPNANRFQVVAVPFLEYASYTNYSATSWYLLSDPRRLAAFEIAFLDGKTAPTLRQDLTRIGTAGIEFDGKLAFGVAQEDYRGSMKITA